jgi:hypothetical protein
VHRFLVKELERNNYILPHHRAAFYCRQLNLKFQEIGYYRDVHMWLPHEQWGIMFMPACKNCKCGTDVRQFFMAKLDHRVLLLDDAAIFL